MWKRHFTYVTAHSPTLPSLYLRHNSFTNPPVASPTSQIILQPFFRLSYVTGFSLTSPGEPPMACTHSGRSQGGVMAVTEKNFMKLRRTRVLHTLNLYLFILYWSFINLFILIYLYQMTYWVHEMLISRTDILLTSALQLATITVWPSCWLPKLWNLGPVMLRVGRLFGIVVSTSDCHPRGPGFHSRLYSRNFSGSIGSGTGSTQPREDNWVATWYEK